MADLPKPIEAEDRRHTAAQIKSWHQTETMHVIENQSSQGMVQ